MNEHHTNEKFYTEQHASISDAVMCHLPYAIFSVALSIIALSLVFHTDASGIIDAKRAHRLFHTLHFMHILFATTGVVLTFRRYAKGIISTLLVGITVPIVFCTLSDAVMPYFGGKLLGLSMQFHWCFMSHFWTILPFLLVGIMNGWVLSSHHVSKYLYYSIGSHFMHIFISALAATFYFVSFGLTQWWHHLGFLFSFLILAVVIPCTLADLVVPIMCGRLGGKIMGNTTCCAGKDDAEHSN